MKKESYIYFLAVCFALLLPAHVFAAEVVTESGDTISHPRAFFQNYEYRFKNGYPYTDLSIFRSLDRVHWEMLEQKISTKGRVITDSIVYDGALYVSLEGRPAQVLKTTDGVNFTNVIDASDSLYNLSVGNLSHFFTTNNTLCIIGQDNQTHCTGNGESWTAKPVTGYLYDKRDYVAGIVNILESEGTVFALVAKSKNHGVTTRTILLSSVDGVDWQVVKDYKNYFLYRGWTENLHLAHFHKKLYVFVPSESGSGAQILTIAGGNMARLETTGLSGLLGFQALAYDQQQKVFYIYGNNKTEVANERCFYRSTNLQNWEKGVCIQNTRQRVFRNFNLRVIDGQMYIGHTKITF